MNLIFAEGAHQKPVRRFVVPLDLHLGPGKEEGCAPATAPPHTPNPALVALIQQRIEHGSGAMPTEKDPDAAKYANDRMRRQASLKSALSVLCHVAAMDKPGHFTYSQKNQPPNNKNITGRSSISLCRSYSLMDIYTTVRALMLEYDDVLQQQNSGSGKQQFDPQAAAAALTATEGRVDACLALLEPTLLGLIINFDRARELPAGYVMGILRTLPQAFAVEKWPCKVLQKEDSKRSQQKRPRDDGNAWNNVGDAATAIVLNTLREIKNSDCLRVVAASSAKGPNALSPANAPSWLTFEDVMTRASNGVYRSRGLYGALHDTRVFLYGRSASVRQEQEASITAARVRFEHSLRCHYGDFLRKCGLKCWAEKSLLPEETMFGVNPLPKEEDATSYTDVQRKCLKLLDLLRAVDTNKWFEYPVFDMANLELSSVERWVRSKSFGVKTNRDAFTAFRDVLEQMVDNCVLSYGPMSPFSQVITMIRQRLVDAAREVGLL
ncbi:hypothetical protein DQ04_01781120 [Trypanosoma grayi]|uniref:hypothetical protein n=1 Tax=Trypanosoma grayi TaxID=71804 RepID=UPI0004F45282|nr:hypothetical protein DQ04_01781120 [Trypanosoma grayi]KEG12348.1 hypothetical protein DQ04_01781120 [Trypanosoma grayi]